jgi:HK97 family phage portal protein
MTLHLLEKGENGDIRVKNELSYFMDIAPSKYMNRKELFTWIVKNMMLNGNAFVLPRYGTNGYLTDLIPLPFASIINDLDNGNYGYHIQYKENVYQYDDVLHFRLNPNELYPWCGDGFKFLLRDVAKNLAQAENTKRAFMENPVPSMVVKVDAITDEFTSEAGREKLKEQYISMRKSGEPWIIPAELVTPIEFKPLTLTDLALNDNVDIDKRMAAAIFGVPPFLVGVGDFKKDEYNAFINSVLLPIAKTIEQELTRKLIFGGEWFFRFNSRSLYAYDLSELVSAGKDMVDRMALRRNEWRDWVGLSPDDDMQDLLGLENYLPIEMLGQQKKLLNIGAFMESGMNGNGGDDNA